MADTRYFVYVNEGTYNKLSSDSGLYSFKDGKPVAVENRNDQFKFAGDPNFVETDKNGKELDFTKGALPSNNPEGPLSYVKLEKKGEDKPSPASSSEEDVEKEEEKKSSKKKSSKKKASRKKSKKKEDKEEKSEKEDE